MRTKAKHGITLPTESVSELSEATRRELERVYVELSVFHSWPFVIPGPVVDPFTWQYGIAGAPGDPVFKTMRNRKVVSLAMSAERTAGAGKLQAYFYTVPGAGYPVVANADVARTVMLGTAVGAGIKFGLADAPPTGARTGVDNWGKDQGFALSVFTTAASTWQNISLELTYLEFVPTVL